MKIYNCTFLSFLFCTTFTSSLLATPAKQETACVPVKTSRPLAPETSQEAKNKELALMLLKGLEARGKQENDKDTYEKILKEFVKIHFAIRCVLWEDDRPFPALADSISKIKNNPCNLEIDYQRIFIKQDMFSIKQISEKKCQVKDKTNDDALISFISDTFSQLPELQKKLEKESHLLETNPMELMSACSEVLMSMKKLYEYKDSNLKDFRDSYWKNLNPIVEIYGTMFHLHSSQETQSDAFKFKLNLLIKDSLMLTLKAFTFGMPSNQNVYIKQLKSNLYKFYKLEDNGVDKRVYEVKDFYKDEKLAEILKKFQEFENSTNEKKFSLLEEYIGNQEENTKLDKFLIVFFTKEFFEDYTFRMISLHLLKFGLECFKKRVQDFCTLFEWKGGWYQSDFLPELKKMEHQILQEPEKVEDQSLYYPEKQKETLQKKSSQQGKNKKNHKKNLLSILRELQSFGRSKAEDSDRQKTSVSAVSKPKKSLVDQSSVSPHPAEPLFQEKILTQEEEKAEKRKRHEKKELERVNESGAKNERAEAAILPPQEEPPLQGNADQTQNQRTDIPIFGTDKKCVQLVKEQINNNTWKFTREDLIQYFAERGCILCPDQGKGSHFKIKIPIKLLKNTLQSDGFESFTLYQWDKEEKSIPTNLRKTIRKYVEGIEKKRE
ncbi:MAG: hypothetical protein K2P90_03895 [Holosporales bacterium]|nr:hypothetical protein [Holosporales bacterium]